MFWPISLGAVEVLFRAVPPVARQAGLVAIANVAGALLPGPPVVVGVVAFYLMRGGRRAPQEAFGKPQLAM